MGPIWRAINREKSNIAIAMMENENSFFAIIQNVKHLTLIRRPFFTQDSFSV